MGGDSDTLAAITCAVAGAYYGVPEEIANKAMEYLDSTGKAVLEIFSKLKVV